MNVENHGGMKLSDSLSLAILPAKQEDLDEGNYEFDIRNTFVRTSQ
jgi:hypothetical protein